MEVAASADVVEVMKPLLVMLEGIGVVVGWETVCWRM